MGPVNTFLNAGTTGGTGVGSRLPSGFFQNAPTFPSVFGSQLTGSSFNNGFASTGTGFPGFGTAPTGFNNDFGTGFNNLITSVNGLAGLRLPSFTGIGTVTGIGTETIGTGMGTGSEIGTGVGVTDPTTGLGGVIDPTLGAGGTGLGGTGTGGIGTVIGGTGNSGTGLGSVGTGSGLGNVGTGTNPGGPGSISIGLDAVSPI